MLSKNVHPSSPEGSSAWLVWQGRVLTARLGAARVESQQRKGRGKRRKGRGKKGKEKKKKKEKKREKKKRKGQRGKGKKEKEIENRKGKKGEKEKEKMRKGKDPNISQSWKQGKDGSSNKDCWGWAGAAHLKSPPSPRRGANQEWRWLSGLIPTPKWLFYRGSAPRRGTDPASADFSPARLCQRQPSPEELPI